MPWAETILLVELRYTTDADEYRNPYYRYLVECSDADAQPTADGARACYEYCVPAIDPQYVNFATASEPSLMK